MQKMASGDNLMITDTNTLEKVKTLGLNSYEAKIWTALLSKGVATSGELSDIANVPRSRSYDVLESLEAKGFVVMKLGKPIKYIAVPPTEVIERLKSRIRSETESKTKLIDEFKTTDLFDTLSLLHDKGIDSIDPTDISGIIKGRKQIYHKIQEMITEAKKSAIIVTSGEELNKKKRYILSGLKKNGTQIDLKAFIKNDLSKVDEQLQSEMDITSVDVKSRFVITDNKDVLFMLMDNKDVHPNYDSAIWVRSPFFAGTLTGMLKK